MANKRQKKHQRKQAKRKLAKRRTKIFQQARVSAGVSTARKWPLKECLVTENFRDTTNLTQVAIARQGPLGQVAVTAFIIDLGCLGAKNALINLYPSNAVYEEEYRDFLTSSQAMISCDIDLAAKIIFAAIEYAKSLGFKPHKDCRNALKFLHDANPENCPTEIPTGGEDGQPLYFAGPYDNWERILQTLNRSVGEDNYHATVPIGPPDMFEDIDWPDE